jgi:hypothetical protein
VSQEILSSNTNKDICETYGCSAKATTEISVKVGKQGTISLRVCKDCENKFD